MCLDSGFSGKGTYSSVLCSLFLLPHGTLLMVLLLITLNGLVGGGTFTVPNNKDRHDECDLDHIRSVCLAPLPVHQLKCQLTDRCVVVALATLLGKWLIPLTTGVVVACG